MISCKYCGGDLELMTVVDKGSYFGWVYKGWIYRCPLCGRRSMVDEIQDNRKQLNNGE